jgi:hypothetical protein
MEHCKWKKWQCSQGRRINPSFLCIDIKLIQISFSAFRNIFHFFGGKIKKKTKKKDLKAF